MATDVRRASADGAKTRPAGGGRRRVLGIVVSLAAAIGFFVFVIPQIKDIGPTLARLRSGNMWWLAGGGAFEAVSLVAYVTLFRTVFATDGGRIGWRASVQITFAGDLAAKLFAAAGAGSIALTVWALRASGIGSSTVARRMVCLEVLLYAVYMAALVVTGLGLWTGVFPGGGPPALTLVPAILATVVIVLALVGPRARIPRKLARWLGPLNDGVRTAIKLAGSRRQAPVSAVAYWAFDIAALWASFRAFGHAPPAAVIVLCYFIGTLGSALPLPGGIGGIEGGMIGAFLAFGVSGSLAVIAVLAYRAISYWLPTLPGAVAYVRLRGTVASWRRSRSA